MSNNNARHYRVADQIQKDLAVLIRTEVKDPDLSVFVTIEEVRVTRDLGQAKIYFTTLDDKGEMSELILNKASGYLRSALGKRIRIRSIPQLFFVFDTTTQEGGRISSLIDKALSADAAGRGEHNQDEESSEDNQSSDN